MFDSLDDSLEAFLRAEVPLPERDVDVSFAAPDRQWGAALGRPTVDLFLYDVRRDSARRESGMELVQSESGPVRRPPLPRVNCHYLLTAWTMEVPDEHRLLGRIMAALLVTADLPEGYLRGQLADVRPVPDLALGDPQNGRDVADFWSALGGQLKPGIDLVVTVTLDRSVLTAAGTPVDRVETTTVSRRSPGARAARRLVAGRVPAAAAGAPVTTRRGGARVQQDGTFLVGGDSGDEVVVHTRAGALSGRVPESGGLVLGTDDGPTPPS